MADIELVIKIPEEMWERVKIVLIRKNVSIEIDKERFEKYFEKVESKG